MSVHPNTKTHDDVQKYNYAGTSLDAHKHESFLFI